ncbi:hypothetical protein [Bacillus gaemokensis]|uniref:hypothetical protein n=1 Tax=Bacillus gaemokensis TaxID=574375 RepID=UPI00068EF7BD|nr:hypothetical protein [Bacillus gaemokensis]KYG36567.1 hypothetical protein AZF08_25555 [Bacillus gaemokensis]
MPTIPNFPEYLNHEHHAWHIPSAHPDLPTRQILPPNPGAGLEFITFHQNFIAKFHAWYDSQPFADQNAVAPWTSIPQELKVASAGWNSQFEADEKRILTNNPPFASLDELGLFIERGLHNQFLHGAAARVYNEPIVGSIPSSPLSTLFYKIHGLIDYWCSSWEKRGFSGSLATARQTDDQLDLFAVDKQGRVNVMWVVGTGRWQGPIPLTAPNYVPSDAVLRTAHQTDEQLNLFFVDNQGRVNVMWVVGTGNWQGPIPLTAPNVAIPGSGIATAHQTDEQLDLFFVDKQGRVNIMWVVGTGNWQGPIPLTAPYTSYSTGMTLVTAHQTDEQLDLFFLDTSGRVNVMWVVGTGNWQGPIPLTTVFKPFFSRIGGTARQTDEQLDLFTVDDKGRVNVMWVVGTGNWQGPIPLTAPNFVPVSTIPATARQTDEQIDLFFVDKQRRVNVMWVVNTEPWKGPIPLTEPNYVSLGTNLATARQTDEQIDLFFVDKYGRINVMWVVNTEPWQGPVPLT